MHLHRVFVYGTLKRNFCRHDALEGQRFIGLAETLPVYKLVDLGDYPGLIPHESGICVSGELFEVDSQCMQTLDVIECGREGLYRRQSVKLKSPFHKLEAETYIYLLPTDGYAEISQWT